MIDTIHRSLPSKTDIAALALASQGFIYLRPLALTTTAQITVTTFLLDRLSAIGLNFIRGKISGHAVIHHVPAPIRNLGERSIRVIRFGGSVIGAFLINTRMNYSLLVTHAPVFAASVIGSYALCALAKATVIYAYRTCRIQCYYKSLVAEENAKLEEMKKGPVEDPAEERSLIQEKREAICAEFDKLTITYTKSELGSAAIDERAEKSIKGASGHTKFLCQAALALNARFKVLDQQEKLLPPASEG